MFAVVTPKGFGWFMDISRFSLVLAIHPEGGNTCFAESGEYLSVLHHEVMLLFKSQHVYMWICLNICRCYCFDLHHCLQQAQVLFIHNLFTVESVDRCFLPSCTEESETTQEESPEERRMQDVCNYSLGRVAALVQQRGGPLGQWVYSTTVLQ